MLPTTPPSPWSTQSGKQLPRIYLVIRDRVQSAIADGKTLEQIQAAGLTKEYDERWDSGRRIGGAAAMLESAYKDFAP